MSRKPGAGPRTARRVPAWRDPNRMSGSLVAAAVAGIVVWAVTTVLPHIHIAIAWR